MLQKNRMLLKKWYSHTQTNHHPSFFYNFIYVFGANVLGQICVCTIHTAVCNYANNCCNGKLKPFELFADELEWNFLKKKVRVAFYIIAVHTGGKQTPIKAKWLKTAILSNSPNSGQMPGPQLGNKGCTISRHLRLVVSKGSCLRKR